MLSFPGTLKSDVARQFPERAHDGIGLLLPRGPLTDYESEYRNILQTLSTGLKHRVINGHEWYKNNQYLFYGHDPVSVYSGPISAQVTLALIGWLTSSAIVSTPV